MAQMTIAPREAKDLRATVDLFEKCRRFTMAHELNAKGLYPFFQPIERSMDTEVIIRGERKVMVGSNNYLGLTHHPQVLASAREALDRYGSGCTGSRFLNGTLDLHETLEERLAGFLGYEAALVMSTGYQTNLGAISGLLGRRSVVLQDRLNHASLVDAAMLGGAEMVRYAHNDPAALGRALQGVDGAEGVLVVTDGVFSMSGEIARLPQLIAAAREHGARIMVDDAHAVGVLGTRGRGTAEHFGLEHEVDMVTATFSKSFASVGGVVAGPDDVIHYLRHHARTLIFSASMPPSAVATVIACLDVIEQEPERREALWRNAGYLRDGLRSLGFDTGRSETPIIPVLTGNMEPTFTLWRALFDAGVFTNPVLPPAVPEGGCRIRTSVMATHTTAQLDFVLDAFKREGRTLGFI
jgi:8-amino-7-oxononanoate synthase